MKLVEKKCPNCGADLSFDCNSSEVTCKYCKTGFMIQRDDNLDTTQKNDPDAFSLQVKAVKGLSMGIFIFAAIIFLFVFVIFFFMFFDIFPEIFN